MTSTDAIAAIADLHARYSISLDRRQVDRLRSCFLPDATLRVGGAVICTGNEAIADRLTSRAPEGVLHLVSTISVEPLDSERWVSTAYFQLYDTITGTLTGVGSYDDQIVWSPNGRATYDDRSVTYLWKAT